MSHNTIRVFVYWNVHLSTWSVKALSGPERGRVILRADHVTVREATGRVSQSGRARVIRDGRKNVHAGIVGHLSHTIGANGRGITYNPYRDESFVWRDDRTPFEGAGIVAMSVANGRPVVSAVTA